MSRSATMTRRRAASLARSASAPRAAGAPRDLAAVPPTLLQTVAVTSRRSFLRVLSGTAAGAVLLSRRAPALLTAEAARPAVAQGASVGDVRGDRAIVWSRTDRPAPARPVVECSTTASCADPRRVVGPAALEDTGFTARVDLMGLPAGQRIVYRVRFQDLSDLRTLSLPVLGRFLTPPLGRRDVS